MPNIGIIRKAEGTDYWIDVPEVPGCVSRGETAEAAKSNIREALLLHLKENQPVLPGRRYRRSADKKKSSKMRSKPASSSSSARSGRAARRY